MAVTNHSQSRLQFANWTLNNAQRFGPTRTLNSRTPTSLEFVRTLLGSRSLDGLHQTKSRVLDIIKSLVLGFHERLVFLLKLANASLESLLGIIHSLGLFFDSRIQVSSRHGLVLLDLGLLFGVAKINVVGRAHGLQVLIAKLFQGVIVTSTLVVLQSGRISVLDSRVSANTVGVAKWLALGSAVHVGDECGWGISKCVH
mmetsp:Transcript_20237/g.49637  ORF Transcript_20237/g.49637 Transcript_20237/m.49637 type:complete len:200 (-) Transcript_20237:281-880(-)